MKTQPTNLVLAVVVVVLGIISAAMYGISIKRAERFERGQPFLPNLNPDEVVTVEISKGEDAVVLKRAGERFVVASAEGYPAKNEAINRMVRNTMDIELEKRVGVGDELANELGLAEDAEGVTEVTLKGDGDSVMVHFVVGSGAEQGSGSYVRRLDSEEKEIFLTSQGAFLNADPDGYLQKEILDVKASDIAAITGSDFRVARQSQAGEGEDGPAEPSELELERIPVGWEPKPSGMNKIKGVLSFLSFDEVLLANAPEVRGLSFRQALEVELNDGSGYRLALAQVAEDTYLQVSGFHTVERLSVERDETDEQLKEKAGIMSRANEIQEFNSIHGSWVYRIGDAAAEKIRMSRSELMQRKS